MRRRYIVAATVAAFLGSAEAAAGPWLVVDPESGLVYDPCPPDAPLECTEAWHYSSPEIPDLPQSWHIESPSTLTTEGGTVLTLPPGYFLPDATFDALDAEVRRLQDAETRLAAENESLRRSASSGAPWWAIGLGVIVGGVVGVYAYDRFVRE